MKFLSSKTQTVVTLGICTALALVLSYLELLIPSFLPIPGIKPGLANTVTVFLLYRYNVRHAAGVSLVRVALTAILFGSAVSFVYSLFGAAVSLTVMWLLQRVRFFSVTGVSVAGAVVHNLSQIAVASVLMHTAGIWNYAPILTVTGTVSGVIVGIVAEQIENRLGGTRNVE